MGKGGHRGGGSHNRSGGGSHRSHGISSSSHSSTMHSSGARNNNSWGWSNNNNRGWNGGGGWGWGNRHHTHVDVFVGGQPYYPTYPWNHGFWPWQSIRRIPRGPNMGGVGMIDSGLGYSPINSAGCCNNMHCCGCGTPAGNTRRSRIAVCCNPCFLIFFLMVFAFIIFQAAFSPKFITMDTGETRIVPMYGILHESVTIFDNTGAVSVYRMGHAPSLIIDSSKDISLTESDTLSPDGYIDFGYWLNRGSKISATFNAKDNSAAYLYIFKGDDNFNDWEEDSDETDGLISSKYSSHNAQVNLKYEIHDDDTYYVVIDNDYGWSTSVDFTINIMRTSYDLSGKKPLCVGSSSCNIPLTLLGGDDVVILASPDADKSSNIEETFDVTINVKPRMAAVLFFLSLPVILLILCAWFSHKKPDFEYMDNGEGGNSDGTSLSGGDIGGRDPLLSGNYGGNLGSNNNGIELGGRLPAFNPQADNVSSANVTNTDGPSSIPSAPPQIPIATAIPYQASDFKQ